MVIGVDIRINELYYFETEHSRLNFANYPEYRQAMARAEAMCPEGELPAPYFQLLDTANRISFTHGFRLGLGLARWADLPPSPEAPG